MAEIITVVNQKGGTGKTTTAINLGCALASLGKKVLLIDMDPHASLSYSFGINEPEQSISDVLMGEKTLEEVLVEKEGLYIAPASTELADTELYLTDKPGRENFLLQHLEGIEGIDYIFVDSPPTLSVLTLNALKAADQLLIPMQMEVLSLHGLVCFLETLGEFRRVFKKPLPVKGIVVVMYDKRKKLSEEVLVYIKENFSETIFSARIRNNVKVAEAPSHAQSVISYAPAAAGAKDFMALAKEFLKA